MGIGPIENGRDSRPVPIGTEVLVRVKAVGLNPVDVISLEGRGHGALTTPFIPAWDVAGVIEELGYGVTKFKKGDEVYGLPRFPGAASACAEFITCPSRQLALKPRNFNFAEAAALPIAALTALQMLEDAAHVKKGDKVLVTGAAGVRSSGSSTREDYESSRHSSREHKQTAFRGKTPEQIELSITQRQTSKTKSTTWMRLLNSLAANFVIG